MLPRRDIPSSLESMNEIVVITPRSAKEPGLTGRSFRIFCLRDRFDIVSTISLWKMFISLRLLYFYIISNV